MTPNRPRRAVPPSRPAGPPTLGVSGASTMDSQTKHDFWIMVVAMLVVGVVTTITFAILMTQLN